MQLPSGATTRVFWDISSQLNATTQLLVDALSLVFVFRAFHLVAPALPDRVRGVGAWLRPPGSVDPPAFAAAFERVSECPNSGQIRPPVAGGGTPRSSTPAGDGGRFGGGDAEGAMSGSFPSFPLL